MPLEGPGDREVARLAAGISQLSTREGVAGRITAGFRCWVQEQLEEQLRERLGTLEAAGTPRSMRAGRRSPSSTSTGEEEGAGPSGAAGSSTEGSRYLRCLRCGRLCGSPFQVGGDPWSVVPDVRLRGGAGLARDVRLPPQ